MSNIRRIVANLMVEYRMVQNAMRLPSSPNKQKRTSNKSKLKQTKSKPSSKYVNSKPIKSKAVGKFRNKSNI